MFAETLVKILKKYYYQTEIKNEETNLNISMKINTIWALKNWFFLYKANNKSENS